MMRIILKDLTPENLNKDALLPDFPLEFTLIGEHNHDVNFSGPCHEFQPLDETEERFRKYFLENLTPGQAIKRQTMHLLLCGENPEQIQDSRYFMSYRQASYRRDKEKKKTHGSDWPTTMKSIEKLDSSKVDIRICKKTRVIVIVSKLMKRVHQNNPQAKEMVFIDSTGNTDMYHTNVTFILTSSPNGAMPLGVILSARQDEKSFTKGFSLMKDITEG